MVQAQRPLLAARDDNNPGGASGRGAFDEAGGKQALRFGIEHDAELPFLADGSRRMR